MAIADMLKSFGQGIDRGFTKIGGYDPSQQVSPEEALMRKNAGIEALQRTLGRSSAILSGDPQRLALSAQQDEAARKKQFMEDYIRKNPGQAELLRALQAGVPASMLTTKPTKGPTSYEEYVRTDSTPTDEEYAVFLQKQKESGATKINFADKGFAALGPKKYEERLELASSAQASNVTLDNLENLIDQGLETGFGAEIGTTLNRIGQAIIGPDYKTGEIASAESFLAGATQMILPEVKKLGVNPTDKDLSFVVKGSPELTKSVEGNRLMLKALKLSNSRAVDAHNFDNKFYTNPLNKGKTEIDRNVAFQIHMAENPQIYSSQPLIQEYNNLLEREAIKKLQSGSIIIPGSNIDLPEGL